MPFIQCGTADLTSDREVRGTGESVVTPCWISGWTARRPRALGILRILAPKEVSSVAEAGGALTAGMNS